jgi:hypothetical protein
VSAAAETGVRRASAAGARRKAEVWGRFCQLGGAFLSVGRGVFAWGERGALPAPVCWGCETSRPLCVPHKAEGPRRGPPQAEARAELARIGPNAPVMPVVRPRYAGVCCSTGRHWREPAVAEAVAINRLRPCDTPTRGVFVSWAGRFCFLSNDEAH